MFCISKDVKNVEGKILLKKTFDTPKEMWMNLFAFILNVIGGCLFFISSIYRLKNYHNYSLLLLSNSVTLLFLNVFGTLSIIVVETWIENIKKSHEIEFKMKIREFIKGYETIAKVCQNFFLIFFSVTQISSIIMIFLSISKFLTQVQTEQDTKYFGSEPLPQPLEVEKY